METIKFEYFDIFEHKHSIELEHKQAKRAFETGITVDASDIVGLFFVCDEDFILKPIPHSVRIQKNKKIVYLCRVYDVNGDLLSDIRDFWLRKISTKCKQLGSLFIDNYSMKHPRLNKDTQGNDYNEIGNLKFGEKPQFLISNFCI
jgi:glutamine synthetase